MGQSTAVVYFLIKGSRCSEQRVEDALWIVHSFQVGDTAIMVDGHIPNVAGRTTYPVKYSPASVRHRRGLAMSGLEIVQQIELKMVDDCRIDLVSILSIGRRRRADLVFRAIEHHARRSYYTSTCARLEQIRICRGLEPHFVVERTDDKLTHRDRAAFGKERLHA